MKLKKADGHTVQTMILIRIYFTEDNQIDWMVPSPEGISFSDVLEAISQASEKQLVVSSFDYKDEEDDLITVRNEYDLKAMVHFCHGQAIENLVIYPKSSKNPGKRNKLGLKVALSQPRQIPEPNRSYFSSQQPRMMETGENQAAASTQAGFHQGSVSTNQGKVINEMDGLSNLSLTYLQTLGDGNSGIVYKVIHNTSRMHMAVKSIAIDLTGREQERIKSELKILNECNSSPQTVDFYGAYLNENRIYLCMEFMDGGSLDRYGRIPEAVLKRVCHRVVSGLRFLWDKKIIHRDVKPSNILVNTKGQVKLCDFGVSRQLVNSIAKTYIGTNAYMAPERVRGFEYTIHSDIWSLGLSISEMATGNYPYPELASKIKSSRGVVPMEVLQCIVNAAPPQLPSHCFSPEIVDFVRGCLQKDASSRPSPDILSQHAFINIKVNDNEDDVISKWVSQRLSFT